MARRKYTPKAFAKAVEAYFRSISYARSALDENGLAIRNVDGEDIVYSDFAIPPSITELCLRLGICKDTFDAYMQDDQYADTCRHAKLLIEAWLTRQLNTREKSVDGIKFNLTYNFGWSGERREVELGEATRDAVSASAIPMREKLALITAVYGEIAGAADKADSAKLTAGAAGLSAESGTDTRPDEESGAQREDAPDSLIPDGDALGGRGYYDDEDSPHGTVDHSERD